MTTTQFLRARGSLYGVRPAAPDTDEWVTVDTHGPASEPSSSTMLKHLLLWNRFHDQSKERNYVEPLLEGETKICSRHLGHMTKMAAMPIYGKNPLKNLPLRNRQTDFYETWYVASGTPSHHSLFKWWPWSDLDLFYGTVKFGNLSFSIGKSENGGFLETIAACDLKVGRCRQVIEFMVSIEGKCHFFTLAQSHLHMKIKTCVSQTPLGHF